ncbi:hypothetical protein BGX27_008167 [Mortierella sp. AM989]|nr:hypothetical protein BGX27_008167 [Mortierella sp. AM989]
MLDREETASNEDDNIISTEIPYVSQERQSDGDDDNSGSMAGLEHDDSPKDEDTHKGTLNPPIVGVESHIDTRFKLDEIYGQDNAITLRGLGIIWKSHCKKDPRNYAEARRWFQMAADKGDPYSEIELGLMTIQGQDGPRQLGKALEHFRKAIFKAIFNFATGKSLS